MRLPLRASNSLPAAATLSPRTPSSASEPIFGPNSHKSRLAPDPLTSLANLMPSQRDHVAVETLVQQTEQEAAQFFAEANHQHEMNQQFPMYQKEQDFPFIQESAPMVGGQEMINFAPQQPYEPPMLPPISPYPPGPGPGMSQHGPPPGHPMHQGFPHPQHSMVPPQYHQGPHPPPMMTGGQSMSPNFSGPHPPPPPQQQPPPSFSHIPPGANMPNQNFVPPPPRRSSMGPPGMPPVGMAPGPPPGMPMGMPCMSHLELRIHAMNQRFRMRNDEGDSTWWELFAQEFFDDDARLTVRILIDPESPAPPDKQQIQYSIGRALIPRFFRSFFEGGVVELQYELHHSRESIHNGSIVLDCGQAIQTTTHCKPSFCKVFSEGRLIIHFVDDEALRIRSWLFVIMQSHEFIPRNVLTTPALNPQHSMFDPGFLEHMCKPVAAQGLLHTTVNFLKMCAILEPMQEIMSHHKAYPIQEPRECMKNLVFQKWKDMYNPPVPVMVQQMQMGMIDPNPLDPEAVRGNPKRRKRKTPSGGGRAAANNQNNAQNGPMGGQVPGSIPLPPMKKGKNSNMSNQSGGAPPTTPGMPLASQDVMIVGEPTLMGGEFGDEDERLITRLENSQYDPHLASQSQQNNFPPPTSVGSGVPNAVSNENFTSNASSPRGMPPHGPPSVGSWQQNARPASANNSSINADVKNRSPNH